MKSWKNLFAVILSICMTVTFLCPSALADGERENKNIIYYEDGSYSITYIIYNKQERGVSSQSETVIDATKNRDHYNSSNKLMWTLSVHGTFTYDGRSAKATGADYSYKIYDSHWSFVSGSATYSGATATAKGTFRQVLTSTATVSLTCSANGVLS